MSQPGHHRPGGAGGAGGEEAADGKYQQLRLAGRHGEARTEKDQRDEREHDGGGPLANRPCPAEPVRDQSADDHADAHDEDEDRGDAGRAGGRHPVRPVEVARQPREERAGDEELQATADVREDHRGRGEQRGQARPLPPCRQFGAVAGGVGDLVLGEPAFPDQDPVQAREDQADDAHCAEGPAPAELSGERPAERHAEHRAERAAGHERTGQRGAAMGGEDRQHDCQADASVGRLAHADQEPRGEQLPVVGGERRADRGEAPDDRHDDDRSDAAQPVAEQRQRDGEDAHGQGHDAGEAAQLRVGESPLRLQEWEHRRQHLPRHVVGQQQREGECEDHPREEPGGSGWGGLPRRDALANGYSHCAPMRVEPVGAVTARRR